MPNLTPLFYSLTNIAKTRHYIETGTYLGEGITPFLIQNAHYFMI